MDNTIFDDELLRQDTWQICFKGLIQAIITTGGEGGNHPPLQSQPAFFPHSARHIILPANLNVLEFHLFYLFYCTLPNLIDEMELHQTNVLLFLL